MSDLIPQRTETVVLFTNDDQREIDRLRKAIETAATSSATPLRLGDDDAVVTAAAAYDEFVKTAAERGIKVEVHNIPGRKWRAHVAEHPPREKNAEDAEWGFNVATLPDAVVPSCVSTIGGQPATEADIDSLNDGDFSRVYGAVLKVNTGRGPDPTQSISDTLRRTSPEISESPARLG
jgi:hypothetical protein